VSIVPQRLSYEKIGEIAYSFLSSYYPSLSLPIPIEEIAESKFNIEIIPVMTMKEEYDADGCLTSDFSTIFVDYHVYTKQENRTRFTIAHEIGHLVLHKELFETLKIQTANDLYKLSDKISNENYGWLEYQAYTFAGHVLVPKNLLLSEIKKRLGRIPEHENPENMFHVFQDLIDVFKVSGEVMLRRLTKEGLVKSNS